MIAPPAWRRIAFASDLHLGAETPRTLNAFCDGLAHLHADALFLLGDVMEAWVGDEALTEPWAQQLQRSLQAWGRPVFLQVGNRDFLLSHAVIEALGAQKLADTACLQFGRERVVLVHGDAECLDDTAYQAFRLQVRQPVWQATFLARPYPERQAIAQQMRAGSRAAPSPESYGDLSPKACGELMTTNRATALVHGHTHRPADHALPEGIRRVLSDWDYDHRPPRGEWMVWETGRWQREAVVV
ncbi:UDP-2,3-diacylglucosamine diphosphatase [Inhella gelatinilytica]|uniref:UDP-2,3-diacylglucosamine diphosphatase n=1 Tax=Inhella gelatinilytica TaxID=2795030 RepID=UPI001C20D813|nr:UDP-2,3-diacylglucosamine diphosphatase [Inhella gelatinilytica]